VRGQSRCFVRLRIDYFGGAHANVDWAEYW